MCRQMWLGVVCVLALGFAFGVPTNAAEGTLLIGWHTPEPDNSAGWEDTTPDVAFSGVTGSYKGGQTVRTNFGSNDGTYGTIGADASTEGGALAVRMDGPTVFLSITNGTGTSLVLGALHFDYDGFGNAPKDIALYYDSGDLEVDDNTLIIEVSDLAPTNPKLIDFMDFDWAFSPTLADVRLNDGESATFRLEFSNAAGAQTAGALDNIAISAGANPVKAVGPKPAHKADGVQRDIVLSWEEGEGAEKHDVYFGKSFEDVNDASRADQKGVLIEEGTALTSFDPGTLEYGQEYYWRIDEVSADGKIFKGDTWRFEVESYLFTLSAEVIDVNASSEADPLSLAVNTVNGSGLDEAGLHTSNPSNTMWLASLAGPQPVWIAYTFDKVYELHTMTVWNYNASFGFFGIKEALVEYSMDGLSFESLGTYEIAKATGMENYEADTTIDFGGLSVQAVRITVQSNWAGIPGGAGLSEVQFDYLPLRAYKLSPSKGAIDQPLNVDLSWWTGRKATAHQLYVSTDLDAVLNESVTPVSLPVDGTVAQHTLTDLMLNETYHWKVNQTDANGVQVGDVLSFDTLAALPVDGFETYTGNADDNETIWQAWADGFEDNSNGSLVGGIDGMPETDIVRSGNQAMALHYDNMASGVSTATADVVSLGIPTDWTQHGIKTLRLWFRGLGTNDIDQMYVALDGVKIPYDGDAEDIARVAWQPWVIDLSQVSGLNVSAVKEIVLGLEPKNGNGGMGIVYFDDIVLSPDMRERVTPTTPTDDGLVAHYAFEDNLNDSSGNGRHGTSLGAEVFYVAGKVGQAVTLDGIEDTIEITGYTGILGAEPVTVTAWIKMANTVSSGTIMGWGPNVNDQRFGFRINDGRLRAESGGNNVQGDAAVNDGAWHHVAITLVANGTMTYPEIVLYVDGIDNTRPVVDPDPINRTADKDVRIGSRPAANDRFFWGEIDEVRLYNRTLSAAEIAYLAGRRAAFDK